MADQSTAADLVAHAAKVRAAQDKLRASMAAVAAEVAGRPAPVPPVQPEAVQTR
jgi:hypothetical protein